MTKKIIILSFFLLLINTPLLAQTIPDTLWTKTFGGGHFEWGWEVQETNDGGYIIIADTYSYGAGDYDIWLIKSDSEGNILWTKTFGGYSEDRASSVQQTDDGGYIIGGTTASDGAGSYDMWLIKTDSAGNELWNKTLGTSDWEWGYSARQTADGGYIMVGCIDHTGYMICDIYLVKTNSTGTILWTKTFGGEDSDTGCLVRETTDDGYIIIGSTYSYGAGGTDVWLIKTDIDGDTLWTKTYGGSNADNGYSVSQTSDNGYIITGDTRSYGSGDYDLLLIKTDSTGTALWTNAFGRTDKDRGYSVLQAIDGGYIVTGYTDIETDDLWIIKTDSAGDTLWTKTFGGDSQDRGRGVNLTSDGGYIIVGDSYLGLDDGEYNVYLIKIASETTGIDDIQTITLQPTSFNLYNYPNPFNPQTIINYQLPNEANVNLKIYNLLGQEVRTLVNENNIAGEHSIIWDGKDNIGKQVGSGIYFYNLTINDDYNITKKCVMLK